MAATTAGVAAQIEGYFRPERPTAQRFAASLVRFARTKPLGAFGALMLLLILVVGAFSPWIATEPLTQQNLTEALESPSADHWFGTDENGRDLYSRMVYACQVTALVGIGTVLLVMVLSLLVGVLSGYFGGKLDFGIQRIVDIWLSFPAIFLILTLLAVLNVRPGTSVFFGLGRGPTWQRPYRSHRHAGPPSGGA